MSYSLFLDDERWPPDGPAPVRLWVIARSFKAAVGAVSTFGMPAFISFDHDLGSGPSGQDFARWLVEGDLDGHRRLPKSFAYRVHSMNPVGARNIDGLLRGFLAQRRA